MLDLTTVLIIGVVFLIGYWWLNSGHKHDRFPPGPRGLSSFNILLGDPTEMDRKFRQLADKYGPVVGFAPSGAHPFVLIHDYDLIREVFINNADYTSNRPQHLWLVNKLFKQKGIIFNPTTWKDSRKFALHSMRDFGLGKRSLEERIQNEAAEIVKQFRKTCGNAFDPSKDLSTLTSNVICSITFGTRYDYEDEKFAEVLNQMNLFFQSGFQMSPINENPNLRHLGFLHKLLRMKAFEEPWAALKNFIRNIINEHRETYDGDNIRDLVDLYIQAEKNDFTEMKNMDEDQLFQVIVDLFFAGTETITSTIRWLLLHLMHNPEAQKKCQEEIKQVLGEEGVPNYKDRNAFPYTMGAIHEAMRLNSAGGTLPHNADKSIEIAGYLIPQGATVIGASRSMMFDPQIFGADPELFKPERWIDEDGQPKKIQKFLPFGLGRRACIGEQLARMELLINMIVLLQKFTFEAEHSNDLPPIVGKIGLTYKANPYKIRVVPNF